MVAEGEYKVKPPPKPQDLAAEALEREISAGVLSRLLDARDGALRSSLFAFYLLPFAYACACALVCQISVAYMFVL